MKAALFQVRFNRTTVCLPELFFNPEGSSNGNIKSFIQDKIGTDCRT